MVRQLNKLSANAAENRYQKMVAKTIKVTQTKSSIGRLKAHKACVRGLGLRKINHTIEVEDTPSVRGMINKVSYMVSVEE